MGGLFILCATRRCPSLRSGNGTKAKSRLKHEPELRARIRDEPVEEGAARFELRDLDVLIGLVRLVDRARADDHRRDAGQGKQAGFGTKGNLAVFVHSREPFRKADDVA